MDGIRAALLFGDDRFILEKAVGTFKELVADFKEFDINVLQSPKPDDIANALATVPLSGRRVVFAYDYTYDARVLEHINDWSTLVFVDPKNKALTDALAKNFHSINCGRVGNELIYPYITRELKGSGGISDGARALLSDFLGGDMARISTETAKLAALGRPVTEDDVIEHVTPTAEYRVFDLTDKLAKKRADEAFSVLSALLAADKSASLLPVMFTQFRRMLMCALSKDSDDVLAKQLGVRESAVRINRKLAQNFPVKKLKAVNDGFHELDRAVKTGLMREEDALTKAVLTIC